MTNPQLHEREMNLACELRYTFRPIGKRDLYKQIRRKDVEGILESHSVTRRNNEVTFP